MIKLSLDINTVALRSRLQRFARKNWTPALRECATYMESSTRQNFLEEKDPNGNPWKPLAASTLQYKRSGKILTETGRLVNSIGSEVVGNKARIYTNVEYAQYLQYGTKKMPARQFLGIGEKDQEAIEQIFARHALLP